MNVQEELDLKRAIAQLSPETQAIIKARAISASIELSEEEFSGRIPECMGAALAWWRETVQGLTSAQSDELAIRAVERLLSDPESVMGRVISVNEPFGDRSCGGLKQ